MVPLVQPKAIQSERTRASFMHRLEQSLGLRDRYGMTFNFSLTTRIFKSQFPDVFALILRRKAFINLLILKLHNTSKCNYVTAYPYFLTVEPGNVCMLKCPLCPTGQGRKELPKGFLSYSDFQKILDEIGEYLYRLDLSNWGEPLLNHDIFKMIRYARKKKIFVTLSSNLNYFNKDICRKLVTSGLNLLKFSLYGTSQETIETYQRGGRFEKVIRNVKLIVKERKRRKSKKPFLQWRFMITKHNEYQLSRARQIAEDLGIDYVEFGSICCDMASEIFLDHESQFENVKPWLPSNPAYSCYDYSRKRLKTQNNGCSLLWNSSVMNWDGSVFPCCKVFEKKWNFGNAFKNGFMEVWNNSKYRAARESVAVSKDSQPITVCHICRLRARF